MTDTKKANVRVEDDEGNQNTEIDKVMEIEGALKGTGQTQG